jgi:Glucodextranase, domain B
MLKRKAIIVFGTTFALILASGAALAQVGAFQADPPPAVVASGDLVDDPGPSTTTTEVPPETTTTTSTTHAPEEPTTTTTTTTEVRDEEPPRLEILSPDSGAVTSRRHILVKGVTEPGAKVTFGDRRIEVGEEGHWRAEVELREGRNELVFVAHDAAGNTSEASIVVVYEKEKDVRFTAKQKFEVSTEEKPYEVFWGTAPPGSGIVARSEYGVEDARANDDGKWELKLRLNELPANTEIKINVSSTTGGEKTFSFKWVPERDEYEFVAHQAKGMNVEPWDVFYGKGTPGTTVWVGSEYGEARTEINKDGAWEVKVWFEGAPVGEEFRVVVESSRDDRVVFGFTLKEREQEKEFTANQKYGVSDDAEVWDIFWGTATPGATVWIVSDFGSKELMTDETGNWEGKVYFTEAPVGEPFEVVIESSDGGRKVFTFVWLGIGGDQ